MFSAAAVPCPAGTPPRLAWLARAGAAKAPPCTRPRAALVRAQARRLPVRSLPCAVQAPPAVCRPAPSNDVRPRREPRQRLRVSPLRGGAARRPTCHHPTRAPTTCRSSSSLAKYTEASFKIAFARRSSALSFRSRLALRLVRRQVAPAAAVGPRSAAPSGAAPSPVGGEARCVGMVVVVSVRTSRKRLRRFDRCGPRRCSRPRTSDGLALPGSWRVAYDDVDVAGRYLVPLLEKALGRRNPDLCRYAVRAMEAANPNDLLPERVRLSSARARRGIPILAGPHGRGRRLAGTVAWLGRRFSCPSLP